MVHFVARGPEHPICYPAGAERLKKADVVIYAGSLVIRCCWVCVLRSAVSLTARR